MALLLQLKGKVDFIKTLFWFHIITPLPLCFLRLAPAILLLALSTVLELGNYWLHLTGALTIFFQFGVSSL